MIYLGRVQQESSMMFADINRCKYFAAKVMKQPANPQTKQRYTAICRPVEVDLSNPKVRVYRWKGKTMVAESAVNERIAEIIYILKKEGFSPKESAAILGNIDVETDGSFDYLQKQYEGGPGRGLFQFEGLKLDPDLLRKFRYSLNKCPPLIPVIFTACSLYSLESSDNSLISNWTYSPDWRILYLSGIRPIRKVAKLKDSDIEKIIKNTKKILQNAIKFGGSSIKDFSSGDGKKGIFQQHFKVYGRIGEKCSNTDCNQTVIRTIISNRASFFCKSCQK